MQVSILEYRLQCCRQLVPDSVSQDATGLILSCLITQATNTHSILASVLRLHS